MTTLILKETLNLTLQRTMKKNNPTSTLDQLLAEITPLEQAKTDAKMMLAVRIEKAMQAKNWKKKDLLAAVGKENPSIISKWLSGTHNFTVDTLIELENALGVSLLNPEEPKQIKPVVIYRALVSRQVQITETACLNEMIFGQPIMNKQYSARSIITHIRESA